MYACALRGHLIFRHDRLLKSAFVVAIGGKADTLGCTAYVRF
jgi:hypothetical protein